LSATLKTMDALKPKTTSTHSDASEPDPSTRQDSMTAGPNQHPDEHIAWFRQASPYINSHRGKTFVLCFDGSVLESPQFPTLVHDITLLRNLGIRLVLVHGLRYQVNKRLDDRNIESTFEQGLRITTEEILDEVKDCVGRARIAIESQLSMGLPNTPMSGAHVGVASGNFVTAQPYGIIDGVDFGHTGSVRQIHVNAIQRLIESDQLVLLSPLGYSRTGELFNMQYEEVATKAAIALNAEKLIFMGDTTVHDSSGTQIRQSTAQDISKNLSSLPIAEDARHVVQRAIEACEKGVSRVHILNQFDSDALLRDLFTRDGSGTMINADTYDTIRSASIHDVGGIISLITPLEENGTLVPRSREQLELDIDHFMVAERDGTIVACAALIADEGQNQTDASEVLVGEIACVATHPDYRNGKRAETLLRKLESRARSLSLDSLFVLTTRSDHWFIEQGYEQATELQLPSIRRSRLNQKRNSKVLIKKLR